MRQVIHLYNKYQRQLALRAVELAEEGHVVEIRDKTRSLEQNSRLWAMLGEISNQVDWYGNKLTPEEWKDVFTAALHRQKVVPGIDGGFVVCGHRTSKMTVKEMGDLQELMNAFAAERGIVFSWEPPITMPENYKEKAVIL